MKTINVLTAMLAIGTAPEALRAQMTWSGPINLEAAPVGPEDSATMRLTWQEGGAMGPQGYDKFDKYGVYVSTTDPGDYADEAWFAQATPCPTTPAVVNPEEPVEMLLGGLEAATTYYFAVRGEYYAPDWYPTWPSLASGTTPADGGAPSPVTLEVQSTTATDAVVNWTAPGDDGSGPSPSSHAAVYALRASTWPPSTFATPGAWYAAAVATGVPPQPAATGSLQTMTLGGLESGTTYWFAMVATDEAGHGSPVVTITAAMTGAAPPKAGGGDPGGCLGTATAGAGGLLLVALLAVAAGRRA